MTGKERVINTIKLNETDRIPWVPFVGCHGASLININADEYLKSSDHIIEGVSKAMELYKPDGIPVMFDLQIEAEALGCKLAWSKENPPAVVSHILTEGVELEDLKIPEAHEGRIPIVIEAAKKLREKFPDTALYGLITGPFTLALHVLGTDIFMMMFENPEKIKLILDFTKKVSIQMADYYIDAGCDVIAVVDPMTSQIDPMSFESYITEPMKELFASIKDRNSLSSFFVCGHAQQNIEVMCKCKPDNISIDENIPLDYVKEIALSNGVSFGGNMQLTVALLMGSPEDAEKNAVECIDIGGEKGFILAPGCDLAKDTPKENLISVSELVKDSYLQEIIRTRETKGSNIKTLDLSNRWEEGKVFVDVITLDSSSCAPCQYMFEAVRNASEHIEGNVEYAEFKIKEEAGLQMMASLGVKNIPTICINGNVEFVSRIPPMSELISRINGYLK